MLGARTAKRTNALEQELTHLRARLDAQADRISALDDRQSEQDDRLTRVVSDTLDLGNEVKGQIEGLEERLEAMGQHQQSVLKALDGQLQEMQQFIIKAADDAARQRAALPLPFIGVASPAVDSAVDWRQGPQAAPAAAAPAQQQQQPAVGEAELAELLARQQVLQQQFAQRRRADGEAAFRTPNGAGL